MQYSLLKNLAENQETGGETTNNITVSPFRTQLLKWVGNKQRFAPEIISYFPEDIKTYYEPFLGSGGILGTLKPSRAIASDCFGPLIEIWKTLKADPATLKDWYKENWHFQMQGQKKEQYEKIKASYNKAPNGKDLLFLCRACYGGVVRFRQHDGYMSTPVGPHAPIHPDSFSKRVDIWHERVKGTDFFKKDYEEILLSAGPGDLIYCDPPYSFSQAILYGAQSFSLENLFEVIAVLKNRGAKIVLSIDGTKKSGDFYCDLKIPDGLFEREIYINIGRSMLRRFQMPGDTLEKEIVRDRLLLTY